MLFRCIAVDKLYQHTLEQPDCLFLAMVDEPAKGKGKTKGGKPFGLSDAWMQDIQRQAEEREDAERQREEALRQEAQKGKGKGKNKGKGAIARYDSESSVDSDSSTVSTSSMRRHRIPPRSRPLTDAQLDRQVIRKLDNTQ